MIYPKVSVIIPTYKRAHFLKRAVESVLTQSYQNIQVVVVDDNAIDPESRESTRETMSAFSQDERVKYVLSEKKMGGGPARNLGVDNADGEYVTFLDDDDVYEPPKIEAQLKFMLMHNLDFCFTDLHLYNGDGTKVLEHRSRPYVKSWDPDHLFKMHIMYSITGTDCYMAKKSLIVSTGGFRDVRVGQEYLLMWDILKHAKENNLKAGYYPASNIKMYIHNEDRVSVGQNKFLGEEEIYRLKCSQKHLLSKSEAKYIDFRHYMVLCVAGKRSNKLLLSVKNLFNAFNTSPTFFFKELFSYLKKR